MVDRKHAIQLRKEGKTYKQIAYELNCSEQWCKINLRHIITTVDISNKELLEAVVVLLEEVKERGKNGV